MFIISSPISHRNSNKCLSKQGFPKELGKMKKEDIKASRPIVLLSILNVQAISAFNDNIHRLCMTVFLNQQIRGCFLSCFFKSLLLLF